MYPLYALLHLPLPPPPLIGHTKFTTAPPLVREAMREGGFKLSLILIGLTCNRKLYSQRPSEETEAQEDK